MKHHRVTEFTEKKFFGASPLGGRGDAWIGNRLCGLRVSVVKS